MDLFGSNLPFHCSALEVNDLVQSVLFLLELSLLETWSARPCSFSLTIGYYWCFRCLLRLHFVLRNWLCKDVFLIFLELSSHWILLDVILCLLAFSVHWTRHWAEFFLHRRGSFSKGVQNKSLSSLRLLRFRNNVLGSIPDHSSGLSCDWRTERRTKISMGRG